MESTLGGKPFICEEENEMSSALAVTYNMIECQVALQTKNCDPVVLYYRPILPWRVELATRLKWDKFPTFDS